MKKHCLYVVLSLLLVGCNLNFVADSSGIDSKSEEKPSISETKSEQISQNISMIDKSEDVSSEVKPSEDSSQETNDDLITNQIVTMYRSELLNMFEKKETNFYGFALENKMPTPSNEVSNRQELSDVLDYMAFYHVEEFDVSFNYLVSDKEVELRYAFWQSLLCPGVVGLSLEDDTVHMYFNEEADTLLSCQTSAIPSSLPYNYTPSNTSFEYLDKPNNGIIDVYNSDQLLYALEKDYLPHVIPNSPAERVLDMSREILNNIINDSMSDNEKLLAIHSYIISHSTYDYPGDEYAAFSYVDDKNFPDRVASSFVSFYADGVLLYGKGVCHGFAKALNILATLEGINATKISTPLHGVDIEKSLSCVTYTYDYYNNITGAIYSSHGYSYILDKETNKYGISDVTFNIATVIFDTNIYRDLAVNKAYDDWKIIYEDAKEDWFHKEHLDEMTNETYIWQEDFKMPIEDFEIDLYITSDEEYNKFIFNLSTYLQNYEDITTNQYIFVPVYFDPTFYQNNSDDLISSFYYLEEIGTFAYLNPRLYGSSQFGFIVMYEKQ